MRALFLAVGPDIRSGAKLEPFENVNVYPFIAKILGLDAPKVDGSLNVLSKILTTYPSRNAPAKPLGTTKPGEKPQIPPLRYGSGRDDKGACWD